MANTAPHQSHQVAVMAAAVVASDPALRFKLKSLVNASIDHMLLMMAHGDAATKMALVKSLTPHLLSGLQQADRSQAKEAEADVYTRMLSVMRGETSVEDMIEALKAS